MGELLRREIVQRAVRSMPVVVEAPGRDRADGIRQAHKPALVQTLVSELPVETLDKGVLHGFAGLDEAQLDAVVKGTPVFPTRGNSNFPT